MRFSFVVSNWLGYQISNLYQTPESFSEFGKALKLLEELGFEGVELNLNFDDDMLLSRIRGAIDDAGMKLAAVGTGMLYAVDRLSFTDPDSTKRTRAVSVVKELVRFASQSNAPVIIGLIRGTGSLERKATAEWLEECLTEIDLTANRHGTRIALEAINRYETQSLNTANETVGLIEKMKLKTTGVLLDTFHMNIEEQSIESTLKGYASKIVHFHIADSNRWPPGYGHLNLQAMLKQIEELGYSGWVSAETLPKPSSIEAVKATADYLHRTGLMRP